MVVEYVKAVVARKYKNRFKRKKSRDLMYAADTVGYNPPVSNPYKDTILKLMRINAK